MNDFTDITLESTRLILKRCHFEKDAEEVNPVILDTLDSLEPYVVWATGTPTVEDTKVALKRVTEKPNDYSFRIYLKTSPNLIGICGIFHDSDMYEVGYWCHKNYTRKGIMTEALQTVFKFAKEKLNESKFKLYTQTENIASCKLLEKFGFKETGFDMFSSPTRPEWGEYKLVRFDCEL